MTRPFGITIMVHFCQLKSEWKSLSFSMQTYQMKMLHALYYNSEFPMFLFIGTEQKQYIFQEKTDDLRNDRWYTLGDEFSLNQHKVWLSPMSELRSRVSVVQSSSASLVLLLFQHHHPLIYDTFVYILAHCANCQSMGRGNPYLALEIVENRPKS